MDYAKKIDWCLCPEFQGNVFGSSKGYNKAFAHNECEMYMHTGRTCNKKGMEKI